MNDWQDTTTVQVKTERRQQLESLRLRMIGEQQQIVPLRDLIDQVLDAGLAALSQPSTTNGSTPEAGCNGA